MANINKKEEDNMKNNEMDMCSGPLLKKMLVFSVPLMCASLLQLLFNAVDIIVVGNYVGDEAMAAVGSNTALINLLTNFFMGLSIGANVLVARYFGAKQSKDVKETTHTAMKLSIYSGLILTVVGIIFAKELLVWMNTPKEVLELATVYLRIYFVGMTATMVYNFGSAVLRAFGDTKRPLVYLALAGVINVVLNLIFVIVFDMGVAGVAIATVISQTVSAVLIFMCMIKEKNDMHIEIKKLKVNKDKFNKILKIGLPASIQGIIFALSNVIIQSCVNSFGDIVMEGNTAAASIEGFVYVAMNAFYQATISFTSQNVGAGKYENINRILIRAQAGVLIVGLVLGNGVWLFGEKLLYIYTDNEAVVAAGIDRMNVVARTYALCGIMDVFVGSLRGMGYSVMPMIVSLIGACGLRLIFIFTLFKLDDYHTITNLYMTYPVSWIITFTAHAVCFVIVKRHMQNESMKKQ